MRSKEALINEIRQVISPFQDEFLANQSVLWKLYEVALKQENMSKAQINETLDNARRFLSSLFDQTPACSMQDLVLSHMRSKKDFFSFLAEEELLFSSLSEYVSQVVPFNQRTKFSVVLFAMRELVENLAWRSWEAVNAGPREVVTQEFVQPLRNQIGQILEELFLWVKPIMATFFVVNQQGELIPFVVKGKDENIFTDIEIRASISSQWGKGPVAEVLRLEKAIYVENRQDPRIQAFLPFWEQQGINSAALLPIIQGPYNFGVLALTFAQNLPSKMDIGIALSPFVANLAKFLMINYKDNQEKVYKLLLHKSYGKTLKTIVSLLEQKDPYTAYHSQLVTEYVKIIARYLQLPKEEERIVRLGAMLHDIGKVGVLDNILQKAAALDDAEWRSMRRHPELGYNIITKLDLSKDICDIVLYHHERWDGRGYPAGLQAEQIPYFARIVSVADALEAITSHRIYRQARDFEFARNEIAKNSGTQFDPLVVEQFLAIPLEEFFKAKASIMQTKHESEKKETSSR